MRIRSYVVLLVLLLLTGCGRSSIMQDIGQEGSNMTWQDYYDLGIRYLSEGNYQEAIIAFTAAIEIDPKLTDAYMGRGRGHLLSGDMEDTLASAQADFESVLQMDETIPEAWLCLADIYIRRGDYNRALEILREGQDKTGGNTTITDRIAEIEEDRLPDTTYGVYFAPELDGMLSDFLLEDCYAQGTEQYCAYRIQDDEIGETVATFAVPVEDTTYYDQEAIRIIAQSKRYLVVQIWLGPQYWTTMTYNKQDHRVSELPFDLYTDFNGEYLIGRDLTLSWEDPSWLRLYSMEGDLLQIIEDNCLFLNFDIVEGSIYYSKGAEDPEEYYARINETQQWDAPALQQIWRYDVSSGEKELMYELECMTVDNIGADYVTYRTDFSSETHTDYFYPSESELGVQYTLE